MLRLIGAALVIGCCGMLGASYAMELRRKVTALRAFINALPELRREICDFLTPTEDSVRISGINFADVRGFTEVRQLERVLGRCGAEEQRIAINRAEHRLSSELDKLETERKSKGKVFAAVTLSAGLMITIILI
jgi:hypothetical protein